MAKVVLSEYVEDELDAIWQYIACDNVDAADRFVEAAYYTFQELARMPRMGRQRDFPHQILRGLRSFRVKDFESYLIFYLPASDGVHILHVLHGARNLDWFWEEN
jgi:toxin ParE1/3/4